jgi:hypothetical protein
MSENYTYLIDSYTWIINVDKSIMKLNPVLAPYGYCFVSISLEELEAKFSNLFGWPVNYKSEKPCSIDRFNYGIDWNGANPRKALEEARNEKLGQGFSKQEIESTISEEFYNLLMYSVQGGYEIIHSHEVFFLKRMETFNRTITNKNFDVSEDIKIAKEMQDFDTRLIQCMRLYKNGDVLCRTRFQIAVDSKTVTQRFIPAPFLPGGRKFLIEESDVYPFMQLLKENIASGHLTELALKTFELTYLNADLKSRYLNYVICLESLFNRQSAEISHTISRHTALILSRNESEFNVNYGKLKKLYGYRNDIVHGRKLEFNLAEKTEELQDIVRKAINYCLKINMDKDQLFIYLNSKGFFKEN